MTMSIQIELENRIGNKPLYQAGDEEIYYALTAMVQERLAATPRIQGTGSSTTFPPNS